MKSGYKSAFLCINDLGMGGIQTAVKGFVAAVPDSVSLDILVFSGASFETSRPNIRFIKVPKHLRILGLSQHETKTMGLFWYVFRLFLVFVSRLFGHDLPYSICFWHFRSKKLYDVSIAYSQNASTRFLYGGVPQLVIKRTQSRKKVLFIHDDFRRSFNGEKSNLKVYGKFDNVVALSSGCMANILKRMPDARVTVIPNIIDLERSEGPKDDCCSLVSAQEGKTRFLTVCRLSEEKGLIRALKVFSRFKDQWYEWVIIGDGPMKEELLCAIRSLGLQSSVFLAGAKKDPRPFYRFFDAYLMCSYHEARPVVVDEAHVAGIPVIATQYSSASDQLFKGDLLCQNDEDSLFALLSDIKDGAAAIQKNDHTRALTSQNNSTVAAIEGLFLE